MIHKESFIKGYCSTCNADKKKKCEEYCNGLKQELNHYHFEFNEREEK